MALRVSTLLALLLPLLLLVLVVGVARASTGVCDYCKCPQEGDAVTIVCHCCPDMRDIDFSERLMKPADNMTKVTKLVVSDCHSVSFRQNSLYSLKNLDQLDIVNVTRVNFDDGAFEKLASLRVEKVESLDLAENAFFASQMGQLRITGTKIQRLPPKVLANVRGLTSVRLEEVIVDEISSSAVMLDMPAPSEFLIKGCLLQNVQAFSLLINSVGNFAAHDTTFRNVDPGAIVVTAQTWAMVNKSDLTENVPPQAVCVAAPEVTVVHSQFDKVPECLLVANHSSEGPRKVVFERNQLQADLLGLVALTGDSVKYAYNRLSCDCVTEFGKKLAAIGQRDPWVLDNNYCDTTKCPNQLPLSILVKYLEEDKAAAKCSEEELCKRAPTTSSTTTTTTASPHTQARGGAPDAVAHVCSVISVLSLSLVWMVL